MAREDLHFRLRIPEELKNKVEEASAQNGRSMTAEMVDRLELSFNEGSRQDYSRRVDLLLDNEARLRDAVTRAVAALDQGDVGKARELLLVGAYFERRPQE
ncbi:Arc family DNA-binding protein [Rhizobium rhizophilum]|uniref:Arc family DNA-binding protein n=1 Tax=Rhizobium rhizophilum TaxID=1850373 RepID=A0ABY2QU80_9HYPH|nr:Arc family DNA-binding protein [Rhizobium rhizophilum]THV13847.1 Arc family DNA-binding protein [Rhizobium rhizophilum]